ncbi:MAG TPA: multidrug effflux MFS transporter [Rhabdochlamydiaceae bacterium]|nr:multidrug effflux MFS transporter [Rhabdochlamydiaceae bacterium]
MNKTKELKYLFLIIVIFIAACVETDIYLPAFPDMMNWFAVSEGAIQSLLTWNFIGICISGPLYGPLSDSFGRKTPLMLALGMFLAGSVITVFAQHLDQMLWGRILQGLGSGGCFTIGTAIIFDAFEKEKAIKATTYLNTIVPLIMAAAPLVGGYLNQTFGFRSNFLAIAILVLVSFTVALLFFEETLVTEKRRAFQIKSVMGDFKEAFCNLAFWQMTIINSVLFGGYIAFLSGTAVLFVVEFGISKSVFPFIQAALLGGWVLGSLVLNRSIAKWGIPTIKKAGTTLCVIGGLGLIAAIVLAPRDPYFLTSGMVFYAFGANWIIGLYFPEGMEILPHIKGVTASLLTSVRLLIGAFVVGLASVLYNGTIYPLAAIVIGTIVVILPTLILYEKRAALERTKQHGLKG